MFTCYESATLGIPLNPQGKRKRGRPRNSWRRDLEADIKRLGLTWNQLERKAQDRDSWRTLVGGLGPRRGTRHNNNKESLSVILN